MTMEKKVQRSKKENRKQISRIINKLQEKNKAHKTLRVLTHRSCVVGIPTFWTNV